MFPESFAEEWIAQTTKAGDTVLDPFAGRGTAPFQALLMGRKAIGGDINPVAYVLTGAKVRKPSRVRVSRRLDQLRTESRRQRAASEMASELPPFFRRAFYPSTLRQLLFLRRRLDWRGSDVDRFIAALALGSLHGEMDKSHSYFSNQMPRTISTKPRYSLAFWNKHGLWPRKRDVFDILDHRSAFRFASPGPDRRGQVFLSDARRLSAEASRARGAVALLLTSPPYLDVTNFTEDQWLRLWFLGGSPQPAGTRASDDRHETAARYWAFICSAWKGIRPLLARRSHLVCRLGGRGLQAEAIRDALQASTVFLARRAELVSCEVSEIPPHRRQAAVFRPGANGYRFEVDLHFRLVQ
jgi:hypothetical protein